jgi:hypothetical protein
MSGERIFLLVLGALTATRLLGVVSPTLFARMAAGLWRSRVFRRWMKPYGVVLIGVGGLGLYLAWGPLSVQAVVAAALSVFLAAMGVALLAGWVLRFGDRMVQLISDPLLCRVLCSAAVVIGLLLVCLAIC